MRKAIRDTNVILNMAISPGMLLVPSNMIIQTSTVSGYNNILTLAARGGMKFGMNSAVNYLKPNTEDIVGDNTPIIPTIGERTVADSASKRIPIYADTVSNNPTDVYKEYLYLLITTTLGGVLISKYVV